MSKRNGVLWNGVSPLGKNKCFVYSNNCEKNFKCDISYQNFITITDFWKHSGKKIIRTRSDFEIHVTIYNHPQPPILEIEYTWETANSHCGTPAASFRALEKSNVPPLEERLWNLRLMRRSAEAAEVGGAVKRGCEARHHLNPLSCGEWGSGKHPPIHPPTQNGAQTECDPKNMKRILQSQSCGANLKYYSGRYFLGVHAGIQTKICFAVMHIILCDYAFCETLGFESQNFSRIKKYETPERTEWIMGLRGRNQSLLVETLTLVSGHLKSSSRQSAALTVHMCLCGRLESIRSTHIHTGSCRGLRVLDGSVWGGVASDDAG